MRRRFVATGAALAAVLLALASSPNVLADVDYGSAQGRITDTSGAGIRYLRVELHAVDDIDPEYYSRAALTDDSGSFDLGDFPRGEYYVEVNDPFYEHEFQTTYYPGVQDPAAATILDIEGGEDLTLNLTVPSGFSSGPSSSSLDTSSLDTVRTAYQHDFQPYLDLVGPTLTSAAKASCSVPPQNPTLRASTTTAANFLRSLAQLDPISFDSGLSDLAQYRAFVAAVNNNTRVNPNQPCADPQRYPGGGGWITKNAGAGSGGLLAMMNNAEPVDSEYVPGRQVLLDPTITSLGYGAVDRYSVLDPTNATILGDQYPYGTQPGPASLPFTTWPTAGYFPSQLAPTDGWSFFPANRSYDLTHATVQVQRTDINQAPTTFNDRSATNRYGGITWPMPTPPTMPAGQSADYKVTISNIHYRGAQSADVTYQVRIFDARPTITATGPASITGSAVVGATLAEHAPHWTVTSVANAVQWTRDSKPLTGAHGQHYTLQTADIGHHIAVTVTGSRPHYISAVSRALSTSAVIKKHASIHLGVTQKITHQVDIAVRVSAPEESIVPGTIHITEGKKTLATIGLRQSRASIHLRNVTKARHTYKINYSGSARLTTGTRTVTIQTR